MAVSGDASLDLAESVEADGIMATEPDGDLVRGWLERGRRRHLDRDPLRSDRGPPTRGWRWPTSASGSGCPAGRSCPSCPTRSTSTRPPAWWNRRNLADAVPHGPDPNPYVEATRAFFDAGFDKISFVPVSDDLDRFWEMVDAVRSELS
jgi:hypothetical protein